MQNLKQKLSQSEKANCLRLFGMLDTDGLGEIRLSTLFHYFQKIDKRMTSDYCFQLFFKQGYSAAANVGPEQFCTMFNTLKQSRHLQVGAE